MATAFQYMLDHSSEWWTKAPLQEMEFAFPSITEWDDDDEPSSLHRQAANVVDYVLQFLVMKAVVENKPQRLLIDFIRSLAHDSVRKRLDMLSPSYFYRWRMLAELVEHRHWWTFKPSQEAA